MKAEVEEGRSEYLIQVVHKKDGSILQWAPGLDVEREFDAELLNRLSVKRIGLFMTRAKVIKAVHETLQEMLWDIKVQASGLKGTQFAGRNK